MRKSVTAFAALMVIGSLMPAVGRGAQSAAPAPISKPARTSLDFVVEKGLVISRAKDAATWDFGNREGKAAIDHVFAVRNTGATPLVVDSVLTSCHCTTATLLPESSRPSGESDPLILAPGKSARIRVSIDPLMAHAVDFRKIVWIYVKGRDEAALTLTLAGHLSLGPSDLGD